MRCSLAAFGLATVLTLMSTGAAAQTAPTARPASTSAKDEARKLADEGQRLFDAGDYRGALVKLAAAEVKFSAPTLKVAQAEAHEKLGELRRARTLYDEVARQEIASTAPEEFRDAQRGAALAVKRLDSAIPKVTLVLVGSRPPLLSISLDGASLEGDVWSRPVEVDPGAHTLVIEASGRAAETRSLSLKEGETARIEVRGDSALHAGAAVNRGGSAPPRSFVAPGVAFGIAATGLAIGVISGAVTLSKMETFRAECGPDLRCPSGFGGDVATARWTGHLSTVGFAVAGASAALGTALLLWPIGRANVGVGPPMKVGAPPSGSEGVGASLNVGVGPSGAALFGRF